MELVAYLALALAMLSILTSYYFYSSLKSEVEAVQQASKIAMKASEPHLTTQRIENVVCLSSGGDIEFLLSNPTEKELNLTLVLVAPVGITLKYDNLQVSGPSPLEVTESVPPNSSAVLEVKVLASKEGTYFLLGKAIYGGKETSIQYPFIFYKCR